MSPLAGFSAIAGADALILAGDLFREFPLEAMQSLYMLHLVSNLRGCAVKQSSILVEPQRSEGEPGFLGKLRNGASSSKAGSQWPLS